MKTYFAGIPGGGWKPREVYLNKLWTYRLWSYHYIIKEKGIMTKKEKKVNLFLDSGAFSAWSQGEPIDIQEYISFIKENEEYLDVYSNLDVIGCPVGTWKNQMIMEEAGLMPTPVYHYGEDPKWLKRILSRGYKYISLGGMVPISNKDLMKWLDEIWDKYLTDENGMPICQVHGFGLTSLVLMLRYPWYSVDSTSWVVTGRMGSVYVPRRKDGEWTYDENCWKIAVSNKSPNKKEVGQHFDTLPPMTQELVMDYLTEKGYKYGKSSFRKESQDYVLLENERWGEKRPQDKKELREVETIIEEGVSNKYQIRDEVNIIYFLDLEKTIQPYPWAFKIGNKSNTFF
jgi:hypothetical protein